MLAVPVWPRGLAFCSWGLIRPPGHNLPGYKRRRSDLNDAATMNEATKTAWHCMEHGKVLRHDTGVQVLSWEGPKQGWNNGGQPV